MTSILTTALYQFVALAYGIFAVLLVLRGVHTRTSRYFAAALVATVLSAQVAALTGYGILPPNAPEAANALRDGAWLALCLALMYPRARDFRFWWIATIATAILACLQFLLSFSPDGIGSVAGVHIDATLMSISLTILGFALIENVLRDSSRADFWAIKHWAIGLSGLFLFQLAARIPQFLTHKVSFSGSLAGPLVFLIALPFFVVSSTRIPQVQLRFHSSRAVVFHTATLLAAGIVLQGVALAAWYVRSYGGTSATALAIVIAFTGTVSIAAALSSAAVRSRVRSLINEHFFAFKYDYRVEWETVIRGLTLDLNTPIAERALRVLCDLLDSPAGSIWLYRESWRQFILNAKLCMTVHNLSIGEDDEKIANLRKEGRSLIQLNATDDQTHASLTRVVDNGWMLIPLRQRSVLVGFAILGTPRVPRLIDWEDEALIRLVAMQVTAYLVQEEMSQSLADARQLEDFNKRFAFIVHDIKNTIGQLSLMVRNISQFGDRKEFRDDMVVTLGNAVDRLASLLTSLKTVGSQSAQPANERETFDLNEFLVGFCEEKRNLGQPVNFERLPAAAPTLTNGASLRRVLEHVLSNALEASPPGSPVNLVLNIKDDSYMIGVTDRGCGMTPEFVREELFRPLKTTKGNGSGLGAFQIREIMRELGGDVIVESQVGQGTEVTLSLPGH